MSDKPTAEELARRILELLGPESLDDTASSKEMRALAKAALSPELPEDVEMFTAKWKGLRGTTEKSVFVRLDGVLWRYDYIDCGWRLFDSRPPRSAKSLSDIQQLYPKKPPTSDG